MVQKTSPFIETKYGWDYGESGWNAGMDENLLKFSYLFDGSVDEIVDSLPSSPQNGKAYYLNSDNRLYFVVNGSYQSTPIPLWFVIKIKSTGVQYKFNGSGLEPLLTPEEVQGSVETLENSLNSLSESTGSSKIGFNQGPGSLTRTLEEKFREYIFVTDYPDILSAATKAVQKNVPLVLELNKEYIFSQISLPDNLYLISNGSVFVSDGLITTDESTLLTVGLNSTIDQLSYRTNANPAALYHIRIGSGSTIGRLVTKSVGQSAGECVVTTGQNVTIGSHYSEYFDRPLHVGDGTQMWSGFRLGHYDYLSYMRGIRLTAQKSFEIGEGRMAVRSPNALNEAPGYNSILLSSVQDGRFGNTLLQDSGEHCIRIGGNTGAEDTKKISFGQTTVKGCSAAAVKINPTGSLAYNIHFDSLIGIDVGAVTGTNAKQSDGLRLSHCREVSFGNVVFYAQDYTSSCEHGIRLNDVRDLSIGLLSVTNQLGAVLQFDSTADVDNTVNFPGDILRVNIGTLIGQKGAEALYPINFNTTGINVGWLNINNIFMWNLTTGFINMASVGGITGPVNFSGNIYGVDTTNIPLIGNPPSDTSKISLNLGVNHSKHLGRLGDIRYGINSGLVVGGSPFSSLASPSNFGNIYLSTIESKGIAAQGTYGPSIQFGRTGQSSRRGAAISSYQASTNTYDTGLELWTSSPGLSTTDVLTRGVRIDHNASVMSTADNVADLGSASNRWRVIYAGTATINTSDERQKQQIEELSDAEKAVALKLKKAIKKFKFNDAVEAKGDGARIHVGVIAQEVVSIFESEGLDANDYAILCYDEWEGQDEVKDADGNVIKEAVESGNRYGVRYEELLAFVVSAI